METLMDLAVFAFTSKEDETGTNFEELHCGQHQSEKPEPMTNTPVPTVTILNPLYRGFVEATKASIVHKLRIIRLRARIADWSFRKLRQCV